MSEDVAANGRADGEEEQALPSTGILNVAMGMPPHGANTMPISMPPHNLYPAALNPQLAFHIAQQQGFVMASAPNVHQQNIQQTNMLPLAPKVAAQPKGKAKGGRGGKSAHFLIRSSGAPRNQRMLQNVRQCRSSTGYKCKCVANAR